MACPAQRTMTGFPNYSSKLISEKSLKFKGFRKAGASVPGPEAPIRERACVNEGPSQCAGGKDPQASCPPALALQVCLWAREKCFSPALSTFRKCLVPPYRKIADWLFRIRSLRSGGLRHLRWLEA